MKWVGLLAGVDEVGRGPLAGPVVTAAVILDPARPIDGLRATLLAMERAVLALPVAPERVLVDGNQCPRVPWPVEAVVGGDALVPAISAASILAKVARDAEMVELDARYPGYGLAGHKGYPTREHLEALGRLGPSPIHRRSFGPVARATRRDAGP